MFNREGYKKPPSPSFNKALQKTLPGVLNTSIYDEVVTIPSNYSKQKPYFTLFRIHNGYFSTFHCKKREYSSGRV
jgi:hypothetical protein